MRDDLFPVEWAGRRAIVAFPGRVDVSNVGQLRDRLIAVINRGPTILIADMTDTASCDHQAVEAIARACQRAAIHGTQVRLVVAAPVVRRVFSIEGLDRLVPIYPSLTTATSAGREPVEAINAADVANAANRAMRPRNGQARHNVGSITPAVLWQLIDALGDGLALIDHEGRIALVNQRCAEMFGYQREELTGRPVDSLVPPEVRPAHNGQRAAYQRAPQTRPMADRTRLAGLRKDGATLPVEISLSPVPTASETFVLAVIRDATQLERRNDLADLARDVATVKGSSDLLDRVVGQLFQVGLSLQTAAALPAGVVRERLAAALDELDAVIREVRDYAFTSGGGAEPAPLESSRPVILAATWMRKLRMVAVATRRSMARSSTSPSPPSGGRYEPAIVRIVPTPARVSVRSASSTGNKVPPAPVASQRSASAAVWSVQDSSRTWTRTSLDTPATPTRVKPGP